MPKSIFHSRSKALFVRRYLLLVPQAVSLHNAAVLHAGVIPLKSGREHMHFRPLAPSKTARARLTSLLQLAPFILEKNA
jgi:hypothetical protein